MADDPQWKPVLPTRSGKVTGDFRMVDFLALPASPTCVKRSPKQRQRAHDRDSSR
jgi:hypothetical protein